MLDAFEQFLLVAVEVEDVGSGVVVFAVVAVVVGIEEELESLALETEGLGNLDGLGGVDIFAFDERLGKL